MQAPQPKTSNHNRQHREQAGNFPDSNCCSDCVERWRNHPGRSNQTGCPEKASLKVFHVGNDFVDIAAVDMNRIISSGNRVIVLFNNQTCAQFFKEWPNCNFWVRQQWLPNRLPILIYFSGCLLRVPRLNTISAASFTRTDSISDLMAMLKLRPAVTFIPYVSTKSGSTTLRSRLCSLQIVLRHLRWFPWPPPGIAPEVVTLTTPGDFLSSSLKWYQPVSYCSSIFPVQCSWSLGWASDPWLNLILVAHKVILPVNGECSGN